MNTDMIALLAAARGRQIAVRVDRPNGTYTEHRGTLRAYDLTAHVPSVALSREAAGLGGASIVFLGPGVTLSIPYAAEAPHPALDSAHPAA